MTGKRIAEMNQIRLIREILARAPWLTQGDIAKWVGCSSQNVSRIYIEGKKDAGRPLLQEASQ